MDKKKPESWESESKLPANDWISVKDRLPLEGEKVITYLKDYDEFKIDYLILFPEPIWACVLEREQNIVTHWMPLPELPKD